MHRISITNIISTIFRKREAEVTDIIPVMTKVVIEAEVITYKGLMIEIEEDTLFRDKSRDYKNSRWSYRRLDNYRDRGNSRQSRFRRQSRFPTRRPRAAPRYPSRDNGECLSCRKLGHFAKDCTQKDTSVDKVQHRTKEPLSTKDVSICMKEDKKKYAEMCHSGETYGAIQPNRKDEEYYKQLDQ